MSTLKNLRRGKDRRHWMLGATLVVLVVFGVMFVAASGAALTDSPFEGADGNMVVDTAGHTDWCTDFPAPTSGTCATPFPGLRTLTDVASGQTDNAFTQGSKEDDPNVVVAQGSIPPNKNDLTRAYVATEKISNDTFLYLAWERQPNPLGSANIDFELDQAASQGDFTQPGPETINRTEGDILITYDFGGSGTPDLGLLTWLTPGNGHTNSDCEANGQTLPCWGNRIDVNPGSNPAGEAGVNASSILEAFTGDTLDAGSFGEAEIDLTQVPGLFTNGTCKEFGSMFVKSRSSGSSIDAELKDFIAPVPFHLSNCASPEVATQTSVTTMNVGQTETVGDTATLTGGNNPTGDVSFQLYSDANCQNAVAGVNGSAPINNDVATFAGASFTPTAAGTYYWGVSYLGDDNNNGFTACGGDNEEIVVNAADVSITKTADHTSPVNAGDQIGFTVEVENTGAGDATGVTLSDPLPAGSGTGVTWTVDNTVGTPGNFVLSGAKGSQTLSLDSGTLPAGADYTVHIVAQTSATACGMYDNIATLTTGNANNPDPASAEEACNPAAIHVVKTADAAKVNAGSPIGFTLTVSNSGSGDAHGVTLSDTLPTNAGLSWSIASQGAGWNHSCAIAAGKLSCGPVTVPAGTTQAASTFTVHITSPTTGATGGDCPNSGVVNNTGSVTTSNDGSDQSSASTCVQALVDLSVTKAGSPATQQLGSGNITWTIVVTNNGPSAATGVTLADPMPAGNAFVSATSSQGSCTGGAILNCSIGTMAAGASVTITLVTTPSATGAQTNTVTVAGSRPETNTANNSATATVQVTGAPFVPVACIAVSKVTPKQLFVGRKTKLTIHVSQGGKAVKGVHVLIKGPKTNMRTGASNAKGVITQTLKMKKAGILIFSPIASKKCNTKRVGVTGVFTPPVTG